MSEQFSEDEREALARELYRILYPGKVNTHDSSRTPESDLREHDRAYAIWDAGKEGWAPGGQCRDIAAAIMDAGYRRAKATEDEALVEAVMAILDQEGNWARDPESAGWVYNIRGAARSILAAGYRARPLTETELPA